MPYKVLLIKADFVYACMLLLKGRARSFRLDNMASGNSHSEVKQGVEDEITCPVCQDHFQEPKILPCCHYYCKGCIQKLALRAGANKPFPCPECRSDTLLPGNDPNQLPTAFFVNRMKELHTKMEKAHGKVEALCEQCSGDKATAFCRHALY